jgi:hypothetical protein
MTTRNPVPTLAAPESGAFTIAGERAIGIPAAGWCGDAWSVMATRRTRLAAR